MARPRFKPPSPVFSAADLRAEHRRDERRKLDADIKAKRVAVKKVRRDLVTETRKVRSDCLADLRARLAELTREIAEAKAKLTNARAEKRSKRVRSCSVAAGEKRREKQAELASAKKALREDLSLRRAGRVGTQRGERVVREVRQESDKEVIANLEAEDPRLIPIFKRERRGIKGTRDHSRTEAFLEWAQKHPEEIEAVRAASVPSDDEYAAEMARAYGYA